MHIEIKKAEITGGIFLKYEYDQKEDGRKTSIKANADAPIHDDLKDAFNILAPHFVLLAEMKKKPEVAKVIDLKEIDEDLLKKFKVRSFSISEKNGETIVQLTGFKILTSGKTISFSTPETKQEAEEDGGYAFFSELVQDLEHVKEEVMEYMEGKQAERTQQEMEFGDEAEDFNPDRTEEDEAA